MMTRRDVVKWAGVMPGLAVPGVAKAAGGAPAIDLLLLDERFAAHLPQGDTPAARFTGDVTRLWTGQLEAAFRGRGFVLGGITGSDALFVLEVLANHHGRRVTSRQPLGTADARGVFPVRWVIAPHHPSTLA